MASPGKGSISPEQQEFRKRNGIAMHNFLRINNFSQQTLHNLAVEIGTPGPWNSQICQEIAGTLDPRALYQVGKATCNAFIADGDLKKIKSSRLRDQIQAADPFLTIDGRVATATDFYAIFIGEQEINPMYLVVEMSPEDAKKTSDQWVAQFKQGCLEQMMDRKEGFDIVASHLDKSHRERARAILSGLETADIEDVKRFGSQLEAGLGEIA